MTGAAPDLLARFFAIGLAIVAVLWIAFFGGCVIHFAPDAFGSRMGEGRVLAVLLVILSLAAAVSGAFLLVMAVKMFRGKL